MRKYLYFRNVADEDNDDGTDASSSGATFRTSLMVPAERVRAIVPGSATTIKILFDSIINGGVNGAGAQNTATEVVVADHVLCTVTEGDLEDVMKAIVQAVYGAKSPHSNGLIVIADDVTTNVAGTTIAAKTVHPSLTGMAADSIVVAAANA